MKVIETTDFQKDIDAIDEFVYGTIDQETWQSEPIYCEGRAFIKYKPLLKGWKGDRPILELGSDEELLYIKDTIEINNEVYSTQYIVETIEFVSKKVNSLFNTSVDVTFLYDNTKQHTVTLQDWAFWRTLSNEDCLKRLKKEIVKKDKL